MNWVHLYNFACIATFYVPLTLAYHAPLNGLITLETDITDPQSFPYYAEKHTFTAQGDLTLFKSANNSAKICQAIQACQDLGVYDVHLRRMSINMSEITFPMCSSEKSLIKYHLFKLYKDLSNRLCYSYHSFSYLEIFCIFSINIVLLPNPAVFITLLLKTRND